jgi:ribosomal protein S20
MIYWSTGDRVDAAKCAKAAQLESQTTNGKSIVARIMPASAAIITILLEQLCSSIYGLRSARKLMRNPERKAAFNFPWGGKLRTRIKTTMSALNAGSLNSTRPISSR